jgi:HAD superfamily hydrolase (TIGR01549 family)
MCERNDWAVLFDLDETLVLTNALEPLRRARKWNEVYAAFSQSSLPTGTLEFLEGISRMARVGIVTKAPRRYAEKLLAYHKVGLPVIVAYHDVKRVKPDPEGLLLASEKLGIPPSKCIYVGDDRNDMQAAQAAQFTPIGVRWGEPFDIGFEPVCRGWDAVHRQILRHIAK